MTNFDASCIKYGWQILIWFILIEFGNMERPNQKCGKRDKWMSLLQWFHTHTLYNRLVHNVGDPLCWYSIHEYWDQVHFPPPLILFLRFLAHTRISNVIFGNGIEQLFFLGSFKELFALQMNGSSFGG